MLIRARGETGYSRGHIAAVACVSEGDRVAIVGQIARAGDPIEALVMEGAGVGAWLRDAMRYGDGQRMVRLLAGVFTYGPEVAAVLENLQAGTVAGFPTLDMKFEAARPFAGVFAEVRVYSSHRWPRVIVANVDRELSLAFESPMFGVSILKGGVACLFESAADVSRAVGVLS